MEKEFKKSLRFIGMLFSKRDKIKRTCVRLPQWRHKISFRDRRGRDRMVVGFTTTCAISAYHH